MATVVESAFQQVIRNKTGRQFNPCNNWSDAGPIIVENGIGICADGGKLIAATNNTQEYYEPFGSVVHDCHDGNILRAAMIVFLMMNEVEK